MTTANNLEHKYNRNTIIIHWLTAILIIIVFPLGNMLEDLEPSNRIILLVVHIILGLVIFVLTLIRSWIFCTQSRPPHIKTGSTLNDLFVVWVHKVFYLLLFIISITGILSACSGGYLKSIANNNIQSITDHEFEILEHHDFSSQILIILLALHVIGVIKHYLFKKENTLKRIW